MQESAGAREALLRFYEAFTAAVPGDMDSFDAVFARERDLLVIGTAAHEWVVGRETAPGAWGAEGVGIEPGEPVAWEHDSVTWAAENATTWSDAVPAH
jgi:hypothetical protein